MSEFLELCTSHNGQQCFYPLGHVRVCSVAGLVAYKNVCCSFLHGMIFYYTFLVCATFPMCFTQRDYTSGQGLTLFSQ